jgi:hypothetical protein
MAIESRYWLSVGDAHHIDLERIRSHCFRLLCMVEASHGILRELDAIASEAEAEGDELGEDDVRLANFHQEMIVAESSTELLQLAIMLRVYDDQMKEGAHSDKYAAHIETNDDGNDLIGTTDDQDRFNFRDACNKVIHAAKLNFIREDFERTYGDRKLDFQSLTGELELVGKRGKTQWNAVLWVQPFIATVLTVISFGYPDTDTAAQ